MSTSLHIMIVTVYKKEKATKIDVGLAVDNCTNCRGMPCKLLNCIQLLYDPINTVCKTSNVGVTPVAIGVVYFGVCIHGTVSSTRF